jgi:chromosomal replication initiation ATPase DnaA
VHDAQKQIVLTSDKAPADIPGLEQKCAAAFEAA